MDWNKKEILLLHIKLKTTNFYTEVKTSYCYSPWYWGLLERAVEIEQDPVGPSQVHEPFCVPHFLLKKKEKKSSRLFESAKEQTKVLPISSVRFSSVAQSCLTLCNPMNRSMPGLRVHHQLPEFIQTHVHRVIDAIQPSYSRSSPSPPSPNPSQHQSLFQWVNSSPEVAKVLEFQL